MVRCYDLDGSHTLSLVEMREAMESCLEIRFTLRDSDYRGGDYFRAGDLGDEGLVIQAKPFEYENEEEVAELEYADYPVIAWIAWTERGDDFREKLRKVSGLNFLRRSIQ